MISVLYVDDEPALLDLTRRFLERERDYSVDTAVSAGIALEKLAARSYDIIVSDYQMPGMDGIAFLKTLRASGNTAPFIIFTGKGREEVVIQALNEGADFYLQKGGDPKAQFAELVHKIRQAVQQRRAEARIRDHEQREADIINFLPDATFAIDINGLVIAWNRAIEKMTGLLAVDMLGKGAYEYAIPFYHERRPILIDLIFSSQEAVAGKYPYIRKEGDTYFSEIFIPHLNGGRGAHLWFTASPLYDTAGRIVGAIESIRDITERKQTEEALRESEENYRHLFENATEGILIAQDDRLVRVNPLLAEMLGHPAGYIMARPFTDFIHPDDREMVQDRHIRRMRGEDIPRRYEFRVINGEGAVRWAEITATRITWSGRPASLSYILDITDRKLAEEKLRERERQYQNVVEDQTEFICRFLPDGTLVFVNEAYCRFFGLEREEVIGSTFKPSIHPDDRTLVRDFYDSLGPGEPVKSIDHRVSMPDGSIRWQRWSVRAIFGTNGTIHEYQSVGRDITESKDIEARLRESEEQLHNFISNLPLGLYRNTPGPGGTYLMANPSIARMHGYETLEEFMSVPTAGLYENPRERVRFSDELIRTGSIIGRELRLRRKSGEIFWGRVSAVAVRDQSGAVRYFDGFIEDVTDQKQVEEALRQSEEQYRLIAENTADNIWFSDMDFTMQYISPSVMKMKGFTVEEQIAMPLEDAMTPASYASLLQRFQDEMALEATGTADPGRTVSFETEEYCKDGSTILVENAVTLLRDDQGRPVGILGISRDITGRKRVEEALRESAEQYRALVEGLPDIVVRFDCAGRHLFVSENIRDMVAIPAADFIGKTHAELGFSEAQCRFREEAIRGVCGSGAPTETEFTFAGRNGETIFNWRLNPEFDEQGAVTSVLSISRDITLHRQAERNYQTLFREMLDGFALHEIILDEAGEPVDYRFLAVNPVFERMTGRRADEIVGRTVLDVFPGTERHWIETYGRVTLTGEPAFFQEYSAEQAKYFEVTAFRPAPHQFACIFIDTTGRRQAEDALRLATRKLRILSGITRHDILNQVMALEGFLALAADSSSGPEQAGYLVQAGTAAATILRHSEFTRVYEEIGLKHPVWLPLPYLIGMISDKRLPLRNDCGALSLYADPMLEKVFSNLMDNTLRHGTGATGVDLSCEESGGALRLIWADDGPGIPADQKERIFERGIGGNTGFGLFLAREILAITDITIRETGEPGKGARFEILVPHGAWRRVPPATAGHTD